MSDKLMASNYWEHIHLPEDDCGPLHEEEDWPIEAEEYRVVLGKIIPYVVIYETLLFSHI